MIDIFSVKDKVVVITGGMGQLGMEYTLTFIERGAKVAILDMESSPKNTSQAFLAAMNNGSILYYKCNIVNSDEVKSSLEQIEAAFGSPHILINNAALDFPPTASLDDVGPFENYPESSYDSVMDVNVKGAFICCQVFGGKMAELGRGSIINVSSTYGILSPCQDIYEFRRANGNIYYKPVAYSVSKSAVLNLTRYLATYWAKKGVRVNTLTPGGIFNNQPQEFLDSYCPRVPMGRMAEAKEMLGAVIFLSSDAASYVTGSNLVVDGGWSAW